MGDAKPDHQVRVSEVVAAPPQPEAATAAGTGNSSEGCSSDTGGATPGAAGDGEVATSSGKTWVYPSHQQFYNAMKRKGWDPHEEDMPTVVAIHNAVNERCWHEVLKWESLHAE